MFAVPSNNSYLFFKDSPKLISLDERERERENDGTKIILKFEQRRGRTGKGGRTKI
jgi:hypothetical protein